MLARRVRMASIGSAGTLLKAVVFKFVGDGCGTLAAALSFYTFLSLPAVLYLLLTITGAVLDPAVAQASIEREVASLAGPDAADQVSAVIEAAMSADTGGTVSRVLGIFTLLFGATAAFAQLQGALNRVWQVEPDPSRGDIGNFLLKRVFSFGMILTVAFLLLVSLAISAALAAAGDVLHAMLPAGISELLFEAAYNVAALAVVTLLFAVMYRVLPDAQVEWRDTWVGAIVTALLFTAGRIGIGAYLGNSSPGSAYGAAGSLALLMMWIYYTSMVLLLGAVFTWVWASRHGGVRPEPGAIQVVIEKRRAPAPERAR